MQTVLIVLPSLILLGGAFVVGVALIAKIWAVNKEELLEIRRFQGGVSNFLEGKLKEKPSQTGDFRIVQGLRWDPEAKKYVSQSGLSSEGLRAAFPK